MRFLHALLLVVTATLVGCGGDGGSGGATSGGSGGPVATFVLSGFVRPVRFTAQGSAYQLVFPDQEVAKVTMTSDKVFIRTSQTGTMFSHSFTAQSNWEGHIIITPAYPSEPGTFTGTIVVSGCSNATGPCNHVAASPQTIDVIYNVTGLSVTPAQLSLSSTEGKSRTVTLAVTGRAASGPWTAQISPSSSTTWLSLAPSGGTASTLDSSTPSQAVSVGVNAAGLSPGVYGATVMFSAPPSPITYPALIASMAVTLTVGDPSVNFVAPYVVPAGVGGDLIIRGRGFSALSPDSLSVQFNSTPALTATIVSDTEIRATYPPLAAGSYSISVTFGATSVPSRAALKLVVIDPPGFPLHTISRPESAGRPIGLIYDAERQALLFTDLANRRLLRYALSDGGSTNVDIGYSLGQMALSTDGSELVRVVPSQPQLVRLDPVTLAVLSTVDLYPSLGFGNLFSIGFANDGGAIGSGIFEAATGKLYRYDMLTQAVTPISLQWHMRYRQIIASADGRTLELPFAESYPPIATDRRVYSYDASTGALTPRPVTTDWFRALRVSRNAERIITQTALQTTVHDAEFNVLGRLPDGLMPFVLSPDGNFAYAYSLAEGRVHKFNINSAGTVTEVGSGSAVAPANTEMSEMAISPDGGTLFLVGTTSVVIAPAP